MASVVAAATNTVVFGLGRLAGVRFEVSNQQDPVQLVWVILETVAAVAIGVALVLFVARRWPHLGPQVRMGLAMMGAASSLAPLILGQEWPTKLLLALMHLVAVVTFLASTTSAVAATGQHRRPAADGGPFRHRDPPQS